MKNEVKQHKYAEMMTKLKRATYEEYYYEAIFIEYAILEDRTESILKHANVKYKDKNGKCFKISKKLNMIKDREEFQEKYVKKHLSNELVEQIYDWKINRDKLMHNVMNLNYENEEVKNVALTGECLAKKFSSKSKLVNGYFDKKNKINVVLN